MKFKKGDIGEFKDFEDHFIFLVTSISRNSYRIKILKNIKGNYFKDYDNPGFDFNSAMDDLAKLSKLNNKKLIKALYG